MFESKYVIKSNDYHNNAIHKCHIADGYIGAGYINGVTISKYCKKPD